MTRPYHEGMRRMQVGICLLACVSFASQTVLGADAGIESLGWLSGCWSRTDADAGSGEQWTVPAGGTMLGVSRTVRGARTVEFEFVVIRADDDGALVYQAHPSGQASAEFRSVRVGEREVVFENAAHDFPQRVGYRLEDDGLLTAWIEGLRDGASRRIPFPMRRVSCDKGWKYLSTATAGSADSDVGSGGGDPAPRENPE